MTRLLAESTIHTLDPYVFHVTRDFGPRWYGLAYVTGFILAWALLRALAKSRRILFTPTQAGDFIFYAIIGVIVGGRVGHALFFDQALLVTFTATLPWWKLLAINEGGMSSFGGILGVVLASWLFARRTKIPLLHVIDVAALAAPAGLGLGRIANWVNGELVGRALPDRCWSDPPWWSVKFPKELLGPEMARVPELLALRHAGLVDRAAEFPRSLVDACYAGNQAVIDAVAPLLTPRWPNQFFQAITDGLILFAILAIVWWRPRRPGVVAGWFIGAYGVLRIVTEQFRLPDEGVLMIGPLTLPMFMSLGMIAIGALLATWSALRRVDRVGGLAPGEHEGAAERGASS